MKNATLTMLLSILTLFSLAQDSANSTFKIKEYSLRDYVAPDIKFKQLNLGTKMEGYGNQDGDSKYNRINGNVTVGFNNYTNLTNYQGNSNAYLRYQGYYNSSSRDTTVINKIGNSNLSLSYGGQNRWYNSSNRFIAIHPGIGYSYRDNSQSYLYDTLLNTSIETGHSLHPSFIVSVGTGRIQPVTAARRAMDVLISLEKYNRLSKSPTVADIDSLAKIANTVAYKRFYDGRFKRVYQLEEIDKGIKELGLVENADMVYAANLSDIWGYGRIYSRGSGTRFETGLANVFGYDYERSRSSGNDNVTENSNYGGYVFVSWLKQVPLSYAWQSDFSVDLSAGMMVNNGLGTNMSYTTDTVTIASEMLNMSYSLGFYPNTRTFVSVSPFVSISATQWNQNDEKEEKTGINTGVNLNSYYYVSPRFRFSLYGGFTFLSDDYFNQTPFPSYQVSNTYVNRNGVENITGTNSFRYNYQLTISYAIF